MLNRVYYDRKIEINKYNLIQEQSKTEVTFWLKISILVIKIYKKQFGRQAILVLGVASYLWEKM